MHWGAPVPRGAGRRGGGVQRWARCLGPRVDGLRPRRLGAQVDVQRGEELGTGGRAGVVRESRQAKQALPETRQVAAGERLGVLGWEPGDPWSRGAGAADGRTGGQGRGPARVREGAGRRSTKAGQAHRDRKPDGRTERK